MNHATRTAFSRRAAPCLAAMALGLALFLLSQTAANPTSVRAVEPGVNCVVYTGYGGVCIVLVGDDWFCDPFYQDGVCPSSVLVGDTVRWDYPVSGLSAHTTTECGGDCESPTASPLWDSGPMQPGDSFEFTFTEVGEYYYRCESHPAQQRGVIRVLANHRLATATPTQTATAAPPPTPTGEPGATQTPPPSATSTPLGGTEARLLPPATGSGGGSSGGWMAIAGAVLAAGGLALLGWGVLRPGRREPGVR